MSKLCVWFRVEVRLGVGVGVGVGSVEVLVVNVEAVRMVQGRG